MKPMVLCVNCFRNEGIRRIAASLGRLQSGPCSNCGSFGLPQLERKQAQEVTNRFFCTLSAQTKYSPHMFVTGESVCSVHVGTDVLFDESTAHDYALLNRITGHGLGWYAGRMWYSAETCLRHELAAALIPERQVNPLDGHSIIRPRPTEVVFDDLIQGWPRVTLEPGSTIFRARRSPKRPTADREFDTHPPSVPSSGRFDSSGCPALYAAFDIETCLMEMKIGPEDVVQHNVHVARLEAVGHFNLIDLSLDPGNISRLAVDGETYERAEERYGTMAGLTFPTEDEYAVTQALATHVHGVGYDGLIHSSAMRYVSGQFTQKNLVIFGNPIRDGRLRVASINRAIISAVTYEYDLGPAFRHP